jgi:Mg-chelatase subunit ChlD
VTLAAAPVSRDLPTADDLNTDIGLYRDARGPAKVLFVLDNSSSMSSHWPIALAALQNSLSALGPDDDFGILTTPGGQLAPLDGGPKDDVSLRKELAALKPIDGQAALRSALGRALGQIRPTRVSDQTPRLVVLITDDEDERQISTDEHNSLVSAVRADHRITLVVASLHVTGCQGSTLDTQLAEASRGVCIDRSDDLGKKLPEEVAKVGTGESP